MVYYEDAAQWIGIRDSFPIPLGNTVDGVFIPTPQSYLHKISAFTATNDESFTKLFIAGYPSNANNSRLLHLLVAWNYPVAHVGLYRDKKDDNSRGFGFIIVPTSAAPAMIGLECELKGKTLKITKAKPPKACDTNNNNMAQVAPLPHQPNA